MPGNGHNPLPPWQAGKPPSAARLNAFEQSAITDVTVGPGMTMQRHGNSLAIGLAERRGGGPGIMVRVLLENESDGIYTVYNWSDDLTPTGTPIATGAVPIAQRQFGSTVDFTQYATTGWGWYVAGEFVLVVANEEQYDSGPCVVPEE